MSGNAQLTHSVSCPSLAEQDENCSCEQKKKITLGVKHNNYWTPTVFYAPPHWLETATCWACRLPPTRLGRCQAKNYGLESPKFKKGDLAESKGEETNHDCSQLSPLWGCWQGLQLQAGQSWRAVLQEQRRGAKSRRNPRNTIERAACSNVLHSCTSYKWARQLLQKRREASFKRFKAISKIWLHFNFSKQPTVLNKLLMNNRHVFAWCIRLDHRYEYEWFISLLMYKEIIQNCKIPFHWEDLIP